MFERASSFDGRKLKHLWRVYITMRQILTKPVSFENKRHNISAQIKQRKWKLYCVKTLLFSKKFGAENFHLFSKKMDELWGKRGNLFNSWGNSFFLRLRLLKFQQLFVCWCLLAKFKNRDGNNYKKWRGWLTAKIVKITRKWRKKLFSSKNGPRFRGAEEGW